MWDLPRSGLEPVSPALAGGFSTTAPPGKPEDIFKLHEIEVNIQEKVSNIEDRQRKSNIWIIGAPEEEIQSTGPKQILNRVTQGDIPESTI